MANCVNLAQLADPLESVDEEGRAVQVAQTRYLLDLDHSLRVQLQQLAHDNCSLGDRLNVPSNGHLLLDLRHLLPATLLVTAVTGEHRVVVGDLAVPALPMVPHNSVEQGADQQTDQFQR